MATSSETPPFEGEHIEKPDTGGGLPDDPGSTPHAGGSLLAETLVSAVAGAPMVAVLLGWLPFEAGAMFYLWLVLMATLTPLSGGEGEDG